MCACAVCVAVRTVVRAVRGGWTNNEPIIQLWGPECAIASIEVEMRTQDKFRELNMTFEKNEI
jgi:hypothetical protein